LVIWTYSSNVLVALRVRSCEISTPDGEPAAEAGPDTASKPAPASRQAVTKIAMTRRPRRTAVLQLLVARSTYGRRMGYSLR